MKTTMRITWEGNSMSIEDPHVQQIIKKILVLGVESVTGTKEKKNRNVAGTPLVYWTPQENDLFEEVIKRGTPIKEAAEKIGKSPAAVYNKIYVKGRLPEYKANKAANKIS